MVVDALVPMASSGKAPSAPANPAPVRGIEVQWRSIRVDNARRRKMMHERQATKFLGERRSCVDVGVGSGATCTEEAPGQVKDSNNDHDSSGLSQWAKEAQNEQLASQMPQQLARPLISPLSSNRLILANGTPAEPRLQTVRHQAPNPDRSRASSLAAL